MAKSRKILRTVVVLTGFAAVSAAGIAYYRYVNRDALPALAVPDILDASRQAAHVDRFHGQAYQRPATPSDEGPGAHPLPLPAHAPGQAPAGWEAVGNGSVFKLGTLVRVDAQSGIEFSTAGQWYMGLDGEGSIILQDARKNAEGTEHSMNVYVQQGTFRAKAAHDNYKGYFIEITTAAARIHVFEGEIGMQINADGRGRMWLMNGRAVAVWNDGRRKELGLRGLEDL